MSILLPALGFMLVATWLFFRHPLTSNHSHLPPGPPKLPMIGTVLSIPSSHPWVVFAKWAKEYSSDIIHLDVFGTSIVVLDSYNAVTELLDKRSSIYSHRPNFVMAIELMGWGNSLFFLNYGEGFRVTRTDFRRAGRRLLHEQFQPSAANRFQTHQLVASHRLLRRLLASPEDFSEHIRHTIGSFSMSITYGIDSLSPSDPLIKIPADTLAAVLFAATPGSYVVDFLPILKHIPSWFPGAGFKHKAQKWNHDRDQMIDAPFLATKTAMVCPHSHSSGHLRGRYKSVSSIHSFLLGMLANPQAMKAAQAEIDRIDEYSLPYVSAIVKETLRWKPPTPIAIPHSVTKNDTYRGYRIPAGSIVIPNVQGEYPDPFEFRPERFLKDGTLNLDVRDPRTFAFGFGRRSCPGAHMGYSFLWMVVASILCCFDVQKAIDEEGNIVEPSYAYSSGLLRSARFRVLLLRNKVADLERRRVYLYWEMVFQRCRLGADMPYPGLTFLGSVHQLMVNAEQSAGKRAGV
ncbi:cytochrome P450 [Mycena crocata]|nr:cytochrome P450 [Mycena crocata]